MEKTRTKKTKKAEKDERFVIEVNRAQLLLLEDMTERMCRLICGQLDIALTDIMMDAYKKNFPNEAKDADGKLTETYWRKRESTHELINMLREEYWNCVHQYFGIGYNESSDMLFDMYQVLRYFRYCNLFTDKERYESRWTVMSNTPMRHGKEPLIKVNVKDDDCAADEHEPAKKAVKSE